MHTERNIPEMFVNRALRWSHKTALKVKRAGAYRTISWREIFDTVCHLSLGLSLHGIRKDDKVAILAESRPEWMYADMAILSLGAVSVPIFPTYRRRDVEYIINHSEARAVFISSAKHWDKIERLKERYQEHLTVITFEAFSTAEDVLELKNVVARGRHETPQRKNVFLGRIRRIQEEDLASIIYTSGTTGPPKGVMLTHRNFLTNCQASANVIAAKRGYIALSVLPLSHVFERLAGYYMFLYLGVVIVFAEGLHTLMQNLIEVRPHIANFVPRIFEQFYHRLLGVVYRSSPLKQKIFQWAIDVGKQRYILQRKRKRLPWLLVLAYAFAKLMVYDRIRRQFGGRVKYFISGGAKLSREIARFFYAAGILILEGYGLTETSPVVSVNRLDHNKFGTVGIPIDTVKVRIADDNEILVKGTNVMKGYYKDEEATREVIKEGWFYTGDVGVIDDQGFLKITDRKKDIIVMSGGKNVAPQNIENVLKADQFISQVFVCGDGEKYLAALIVPEFEQLEQFAQTHHLRYNSREELMTLKDIYTLIRRRIDKANSELAEYERIKRFALLAEDFSFDKGELTPTMKVKRAVISLHYKDTIKTLYRR